jgi:threonine dehydrogenase-like Zn-dependent dehydrogenase
MRAITVLPGVANSARLDDVPEPAGAPGTLLVQALALGVCGTDREIVSGTYGAAPAGQQRLILGHESLGMVEEAPSGSGFAVGDHVVGIVRRPDPVPCAACAGGEWDMCRNGRYTEHGIKELHGFGAERYRLWPDETIKVDESLGPHAVLLEPTSVVAKAWDHIERIGRRTSTWTARNVLITGAGPIGLLAALLGKQRGLDVHVFNRSTDGPKPKLVQALGAAFHTGEVAAALDRVEPDIVIECTGAAPVIAPVLGRTAASGILCLAGVSPDKVAELDVGRLNRNMVLGNQVAFGTVNANRAHYEAAAEALAKANPDWLAGLISRRVPLSRFAEALEDRRDDIKVVIDFGL